MNTVSTESPVSTATVDGHLDRRSFRPWYRWLLTALAFPPAGYVAHLLVGPVDSVFAAILGGLIAGTGIGAAQWALLRHRGIGPRWIAATAVGLGAGLAMGAPLVSYRTDITSLVVMGAVCGLGVGLAQGTLLDSAKRTLGWTAATSILWAAGWSITTAGGIDVDQQWVVFGAYGCTTLALVQSVIIGGFVPAKPVTS